MEMIKGVFQLVVAMQVPKIKSFFGKNVFHENKWCNDS